jgi:hypothetical protein
MRRRWVWVDSSSDMAEWFFIATVVGTTKNSVDLVLISCGEIHDSCEVFDD